MAQETLDIFVHYRATHACGTRNEQQDRLDTRDCRPYFASATTQVVADGKVAEFHATNSTAYSVCHAPSPHGRRTAPVMAVQGRTLPPTYACRDIRGWPNPSQVALGEARLSPLHAAPLPRGASYVVAPRHYLCGGGTPRQERFTIPGISTDSYPSASASSNCGSEPGLNYSYTGFCPSTRVPPNHSNLHPCNLSSRPHPSPLYTSRSCGQNVYAGWSTTPRRTSPDAALFPPVGASTPPPVDFSEHAMPQLRPCETTPSARPSRCTPSAPLAIPHSVPRRSQTETWLAPSTDTPRPTTAEPHANTLAPLTIPHHTPRRTQGETALVSPTLASRHTVPQPSAITRTPLAMPYHTPRRSRAVKTPAPPTRAPLHIVAQHSNVPGPFAVPHLSPPHVQTDAAFAPPTLTPRRTLAQPPANTSDPFALLHHAPRRGQTETAITPAALTPRCTVVEPPADGPTPFALQYRAPRRSNTNATLDKTDLPGGRSEVSLTATVSNNVSHYPPHTIPTTMGGTERCNNANVAHSAVSCVSPSTLRHGRTDVTTCSTAHARRNMDIYENTATRRETCLDQTVAWRTSDGKALIWGTHTNHSYPQRTSTDSSRRRKAYVNPSFAPRTADGLVASSPRRATNGTTFMGMSPRRDTGSTLRPVANASVDQPISRRTTSARVLLTEGRWPSRRTRAPARSDLGRRTTAHKPRRDDHYSNDGYYNEARRTYSTLRNRAEHETARDDASAMETDVRACHDVPLALPPYAADLPGTVHDRISSKREEPPTQSSDDTNPPLLTHTPRPCENLASTSSDGSSHLYDEIASMLDDDDADPDPNQPRCRHTPCREPSGHDQANYADGVEHEHVGPLGVAVVTEETAHCSADRPFEPNEHCSLLNPAVEAARSAKQACRSYRSPEHVEIPGDQTTLSNHSSCAGIPSHPNALLRTHAKPPGLTGAPGAASNPGAELGTPSNQANDRSTARKQSNPLGSPQITSLGTPSKQANQRSTARKQSNPLGSPQIPNTPQKGILNMPDRHTQVRTVGTFDQSQLQELDDTLAAQMKQITRRFGAKMALETCRQQFTSIIESLPALQPPPVSEWVTDTLRVFAKKKDHLSTLAFQELLAQYFESRTGHPSRLRCDTQCRKSIAVAIASEIMTPAHTDGGRNVDDDYVFQTKKGHGSFGEVWRVLHRRTKCVRACKSIRATTSDQWHLIETEIDLMKALDHPNVLKLFEVYYDNSKIFLVMEYCHGDSLSARIATRKCEQRAVKHYTKGILSALQYCHARAIIHRDIKPDNVLLLTADPLGPVKVIDFGLGDFLARLEATAKTVVEERKRKRKTWNLFRSRSAAPQPHTRKIMAKAGTPHYMSPELHKATYNEKVDLFACGIILYQMLTGIHPFFVPGVDTAETARNKILTQQIAFKPLGKGPAADLCRALLEHDATKRLSAAEALKFPWFRDATSRPVMNHWVYDGLRRFHKHNKIKQAVLRLLAKELDEAALLSLREQFLELDTNSNGTITYRELYRSVRNAVGDAVDTAELQMIVTSLDADAQGGEGTKINYQDFLAAVLDRNVEVNTRQLVGIFERFTSDEAVITRESLRRSLTHRSSKRCSPNNGVSITEEDLNAIFVNGLNTIDFPEFCRAVVGK